MKNDCIQILDSGIEAVRPDHLFPTFLEKSTSLEVQQWLGSPDRFLFAVGKAAISSAEMILSIVSCTDYRVVAPSGNISTLLDPSKLLFGTHPLPDVNSYTSTETAVRWLSSLPDSAALLVILSGGASAVFALPAAPLSYESKTELNRLLIRSGATIAEVNKVRKHCSAIKGGRLGAKLRQLNIVVLAISDVIGDDLEAIGSGPFYTDSTTFGEAIEVLKRYSIWNETPEDVRMRLERGALGQIEETPKPGSISIPHFIVASNKVARYAAAQTASALGYSVQLIEPEVSGSVEEAAKFFGSKIKSSPSGTALIAGGEVTVKVRGNGTGGRNQHLALLMTKEIEGMPTIFASAGTDGIDGNSSAAGAWCDGNTVAFAGKRGLNIQSFIEENDSNGFYRSIGQTIETGATGTNVMDLYIALISKQLNDF